MDTGGRIVLRGLCPPRADVPELVLPVHRSAIDWSDLRDALRGEWDDQIEPLPPLIELGEN